MKHKSISGFLVENSSEFFQTNYFSFLQ